MKFLAQLFFRLLLLSMIQLLYRVRRIGVENVPRSGGVLMLCNHVSYLDSFLIYLTSPRPVRFVVMEKYIKIGAIGWFLRLFDAIGIDQSKPRDAILKTVEALQQGTLVCIFPEGSLTRTGVPGEFKKGFEIILKRAQVPVVPAYMDGLWRSIFSFERDVYFKKKPRGLTCPLQVAFGRPIPAEEASHDRVREGIWEASMAAFSHRRPLERNLETAVVRALKSNRRDLFLLEQGQRAPRAWTRAETLGLAMAMARRWMAHPPDGGDRVGILLPPGPTPALIGLGLFLAGKTPVYFPFTMKSEELEQVARSAAPLGISTVISSKAFIPHVIDFWPGDEATFIDLAAVLSSPGRGILTMERLRALIEPAKLANWRLDFDTRDQTREAWGMIEKPGEEAQFLTCSDLYRNAVQTTSVNFVQEEETIFCEAPLHSAAGSILGFWSMLLGKGRWICRSFSLRDNGELLADLAVKQKVSLVAGTGDFFRSVDIPLDIKGLRYGSVVDEMHPLEIESCEEKIEIPVCRSWEHSGRMIAFNRPDPNEGMDGTGLKQVGRREKSVGRLLPGLSAKIREGTLYLRFQEDGAWIEAGLEASFDKDNFLYLTDVSHL